MGTVALAEVETGNAERVERACFEIARSGSARRLDRGAREADGVPLCRRRANPRQLEHDGCLGTRRRRVLEGRDRSPKDFHCTGRFAALPQGPREQAGDLRRGRCIASARQLFMCPFQRRRGLGTADPERRDRVLRREAVPLRIITSTELQRLLVVRARRRVRAECYRAIPGLGQRPARRPLERSRVASARARVFERLEIVIGEHLGDVLRPAERLDPLCCARVLLRAVRAGDLAIRGVAHENVHERVLVVALHRRTPLAAHELLSREHMKAFFQFAARRAVHRLERTEPEDFPQHRGVVEERLLLAREDVEPCVDHALQRLRELLVVAAFGEHPDELFCVQRIAAGPLQQRALLLDREDGPVDQRAQQPRRVFFCERRERDRRGVPLAAAPVGPALEELRPRRRDDEDRHARRPVDQMVDEVQEPVVGPVEILEDEDQRMLLREVLEEVAPRRERLSARVCARRRIAAEPDERTQVRAEPVRVVHRYERRLQLRGGDVGRIGFEDPRMRLHDLAQRPEADPFAVRERSSVPPPDQLRIGLDDAVELVHEAALADPRCADEGDELGRRFAAHAFERSDERVELAVAADERRTRLLNLDVDARARLHGFPDRDRLRLSFRVDRIVLPVVDCLPRRAEGRLADEDAILRRR